MITDERSGETYHPSTYYLFADDEADVLSQAALHALDSYIPEEGDQQNEEERYVLLDLDREGMVVSSVKSLAPGWAVTNAEVRAAPTFDAGDGKGGDGLMLMVEGTTGVVEAGTSRKGERTREQREIKAKESFEEARRRGGSAIGAMEELASGMVGGMGILENVMSLE